jgi:EAL domain-containing protein (putative c-di-GMP-specific phosphodiesterase class I)
MIWMSINISPGNLEDTGFLLLLEDRLLAHGTPSDQIELELTEGAVMREEGRALDKLVAIFSMGMSLAIADFGPATAASRTYSSCPSMSLR